jgi:predicted DNA-binding transcriptional regulator YafY
MHSDETTRVTMRFSPVIARAAQADRVVRERTIRPGSGGMVEIDYEVSDPGEFVRWALKWGAEAEILGPPHVRAAAASLAREIAARYES